MDLSGLFDAMRSKANIITQVAGEYMYEVHYGTVPWFTIFLEGVNLGCMCVTNTLDIVCVNMCVYIVAHTL